MAALHLTCPQCRGPVVAEEAERGSCVRCPACSASLPVPGTPAERTADYQPQSRAAVEGPPTRCLPDPTPPPTRAEEWVPPTRGEALVPPTRDGADQDPATQAELGKDTPTGVPLTVPPSLALLGVPPAANKGGELRFGDYEILGEIARGGMGIVYKVRHVSVGRIIALKMIVSGTLATPQAVKRFRKEARASARLNHPNIVPIYDVGEFQGQPYFTMKLV